MQPLIHTALFNLTFMKQSKREGEKKGGGHFSGPRQRAILLF